MTPRLTRRTMIGALAAPPLLLSGGRMARAALPDLLQDWRDPARGRTIPVRIRLPERRPAPVVLISHGLGGSRDGLAYLGAGLQQAGFAAIHLQHHGSDSAVLRDKAGPIVAMALSLLDVRNALDRLRDVAFAISYMGREPALQGRLDLSRVAIAGHSFGAWTVTHMLGEALPGGPWLDQDFGLALPDPRLAAGIALSPVPPLWMERANSFSRVTAPILHVTGTNDRGVVEAATPADRTIPFHAISAPGVLVVLEGASHASFAGEPGVGGIWNDPTYHPRVAWLAGQFLRATLLRDTQAQTTLLQARALAPGDRVESKGRLASS
jgi:predicted dienelactone hydrolase